MKYPVIIVPFLWVDGMAVFPVILVRNKAAIQNEVLINHERIHLKQQLELLVMPFYILYLLNYIVNILIHRQHNKAYQNIVFEREAYSNEKNLKYTATRVVWAWRNYL
ncbi:hypothetical protein DJ568_09595 [Mucilaginibacter hurinus]|uniref:Peptidase M56 domain-containing protein n=1 Tax=Mucilaginibacter hurinus TaxID=2201324 RepID=A0A367GMN3_9SPHI|nr:hypothetical protein [Mucilaginibacter hurinus]RCH54734.1 hypothetical protein DJ568_09595 [Mucilaginibacter hurinus]